MKNKEIIVVDNSRKLQADGFRGKKVYDAKYILSLESMIVIANVEHSAEMCQQLIGLGVDKNRIIVCEYEDLFIREVFMKIIFANEET